MEKIYYYTNEKGEENFRKIKHYSTIKGLYQNYEKIYEYKIDNNWITINAEGIDEAEIMLYKPEELDSDVLFITSCEEEADFLKERGFTATAFWTHCMYWKELKPMMSKLFGHYKKIYIVKTLIDIMGFGTDSIPCLFDIDTKDLGEDFLQELSKICKDIYIIDTYIDNFGLCFPTIFDFLNDRNCNMFDETAIWRELEKVTDSLENVKKKELDEQ